MAVPTVYDIVELNIPVGGDLMVLARLTTATVASRVGFDVEEIEDLRLAVNELCVSLVGDWGQGRLALRFAWDDDEVEVSCIHHSVTAIGYINLTPPHVLTQSILDALVDDYGRDGESGHQRAWFRKRRAQLPA
jgi:hypothetical protein